MFIALIPSTRQKLRSIYNFGVDYIYANSRISPKIHSVCNRMAIDLLASTVRINQIVYISVAIGDGAPLFKTFFTNEKEMIIPVLLPFIDPETDNGYYINLASQLFACMFGVIIIPTVEQVTVIVKNNLLALVAVIECNIDAFKSSLEVDEEYSAKHISDFRNIILQILDFNRYVGDFTELFYWKYCLQPILLMYTISISIYFYLTVNLIIDFIISLQICQMIIDQNIFKFNLIDSTIGLLPLVLHCVSTYNSLFYATWEKLSTMP